MSSPPAPQDSFSPAYFEANGAPHEVWASMRADTPVARYAYEGCEPCWLITRHDDITSIERDSETFVNCKGVTIATDSGNDAGAAPSIPMLITMDPPRHGKYRGIVRDRFRPGAMAQLTDHIIERCRLIVHDVASDRIEQATAAGAPIDFVTQIAARLPLDVILALLGVPGEDRDRMFVWSNEVVGKNDPEYAGEREASTVAHGARNAMFEYFAKHVAARRAQPGDDLISLLASSRIDGEPIGDIDILGFCFLLALAGNETTRNATSGGLLALLEHPHEMERLRKQPELLSSAVEEVLRWVSPITYMARTATRDVELHGVTIRADDKLALIYASANRDPSKFIDPFAFDIARSPNDHLAFGFGRHRCLGNELARIELKAVLTEVLNRFPFIELAGPVSRLRSNFVGGIKHMPVRLEERANNPRAPE